MGFDVESLQAEAERRRREYAKAQRELGQALRLRSEALALGGMRQPIPNNGDDRDWSGEIIGAKMRALKAKTVIDTLNGGDKLPNKPRIDSGELALSRQRTIESLVRMGKSDDEIQAFLEKTSGYVDALALAGGDPTTTALLFNRIMSGNRSSQQFGIKDAIELIRLSQDLKSHTSQSDPASIMNGAANIFKAGAETAKGNNNDSSVIQMMHENHKAALEMQEKHFAQLEALRSQQPRLSDSLAEIREVSEVLGWKSKPEPEAVAMKKLDIGHEQWKHQATLDSEERKSKNQNEMLKQIGGTLTKALESPILREAGRKMAESLPGVGKVAGGVASVQQAAARSVLETPLEEKFNFTCQGCNTPSVFTRKQLSLIEASPNKLWACPHCGSSYRLGADMGGAGSRPTPPEDSNPGF